MHELESKLYFSDECSETAWKWAFNLKNITKTEWNRISHISNNINTEASHAGGP